MKDLPLMFLLISTNISGIKNIEKEIQISFTKKYLAKEDFRTSHVKSIYGSNGAGKSGIVHAFEAYKYIATNSFPFKDLVFGRKITQFINKKTRLFSIENTFASSVPGGGHRLFRHSIVVGLDEANNAFIAKEKVEKLDPRFRPGKVLFETKNGNLIISSLPSKIKFEKSNSFLLQNSLLASIDADDILKAKKIPDIGYPFFFPFFMAICFGSNEDAHDVFDFGSFRKSTTITKDIFRAMAEKKVPVLLYKNAGEPCLWAAPSKEEARYVQLSKHLEKFLRLLRPSIKKIELTIKHNGAYSFLTPRFYYEGYDVDYEFESTGIKKLCQLFTALVSASRGYIVFIDEIDAGIHDVFFTRLIEYFAKYVQCQIVVTTHHVEAMETLKRFKQTIDVLTDDGFIVSWKKRGDSSPSSNFRNGALGGVPFNLQSFDFAEVFGAIEEE